MRRMLSALPGSYNDFAESTIRRMQESEGLKDVLFDYQKTDLRTSRKITES